MGTLATAPDAGCEHWQPGAPTNTFSVTASGTTKLKEGASTEASFRGIVGQSSALRDVLTLVEIVANTDSTVLMLGETGTGKELIARALHLRSRHKQRSLVKLNCAVIPSGLLESELFGHEWGAFTGAITQKTGRLECTSNRRAYESVTNGSGQNSRLCSTPSDRVAPVDSAVLVQGETGTGKDLIARAIHEAGSRRATCISSSSGRTGAHTMWNLRPTLFADRLWALLVYDAEEPLKAVEQILLDEGMSTRRVRHCSEAIVALGDSDPPKLVMTDTSLPDGGWSDVLKATCACPSYPPLIVVSRLADIRLYLDVIESGAYDFVVPPLSSANLAYIVKGALLKSSHHSSGTPQKDSASSSLREPATRSGANR